MKAIILVGGGGTRLRPLTFNTPKALVPVANRPLLEYLIRHLHNHDIKEIVLATSRENHRIEAWFGGGSELGVQIHYAYEDEPLGSGGAIREAARGIDGTFLVCNGDIVTTLNLSEMRDSHYREGALVSISLVEVEDPSRFGVADVSAEGRIHRFVEKPSTGSAPSNWINSGAWIFEARALDLFPEGREIIMDGWVERVLFPEIVASGELLFGFRSAGYWIDVGTPETYVQVQRDLLEGKLPSLFQTSSTNEIGHGTVIDPTARIEGPVLIGEGCRIGGYVEIIGPTVLGPGCTVRERAHIERSVLWKGARVGANALVEGTVVGADARIGDDAVVRGALLGDGSGVKRGYQLPVGERLEPGVVVPSDPSDN